MRGKSPWPNHRPETFSRTLPQNGGPWPGYSLAYSSRGPGPFQTGSPPYGTLTRTVSELERKSSGASHGDETRNQPPGQRGTQRKLSWRERRSASDEKRRMLVRQYVDPRHQTTWSDLEPALLAAPVGGNALPAIRMMVLVGMLIAGLCLPLSCNGVKLARDERVARTGVGMDW